jgi:hypothetical protein
VLAVSPTIRCDVVFWVMNAPHTEPGRQVFHRKLPGVAKRRKGVTGPIPSVGRRTEAHFPPLLCVAVAELQGMRTQISRGRKELALLRCICLGGAP